MESPVEGKALEGDRQNPDPYSRYDARYGAHYEDTAECGASGGPGGQSDPEPEDFRDYSQLTESWQEALAVENSAHDLSDTLEVMQDPRTQPHKTDDNDEDENELVLAPDHELVQKFQEALSIELNKELDRVNAALKEKLALVKAEEDEMNAGNLEINRLREDLARQQDKLDDIMQASAEADAKYQQLLSQLEVSKKEFLSTRKQLEDAKAYVSQRQSELDKLMRYLTFTEEVSEELHSNTKVIKNATHKAKAEKLQAAEQKRKQDLYVERLTKELERLTEQVALCDAEISALAEKKQAMKEALSEVEMQMTSMQMVRKQLLQQWNSSLVELRRREKVFTAMQETMRLLENQLLSQERESEGYDKSIMKEQEQNEILTRQLSKAQMDNATTKSQINQKKAQVEALQNEYSTSMCTLLEIEHSLAQLIKESSDLETVLKDQRRQLQKERALRLELKYKLVLAMQQSLEYCLETVSPVQH